MHVIARVARSLTSVSMRITLVRPTFVHRASAALAGLAVVQAAGASRLCAQRSPPGGVQPGAPAGQVGPAASRLPRLLDAAGAGSGGRPREQGDRGGSGWSAADGWSMGRPTGASGHERARRSARRVQPLIVFVSPYASVYATSSAGCGWVGAAASCTAPPAPVAVDSAARRAVRTKVIEVTPAAHAVRAAVGASALTVAVDWLRDGLLRLRWDGGGDATVREVELVVADSARRVLASQRVHAAPYTAVFVRHARTSMVGVSVLRTDGTSTLTLTPLGPPPERRD
jgi:hypothetical protein